MYRPLPTLSLILATTLATASLLLGQGAAPERPTVGEIKLEFKGIKNVSDDAVLVRLQIREGMEYDQTLVDRSIRSLYNTRLFEFIEARVEEMGRDQVRVVFLIQPKFRVSEIRVRGNRKVKTRRLEDKIKSRNSGILDERQISEDMEEIEKYYLDKGYTNIEVDYRIVRDDLTGFGVVTFIIDEGTKLKIKEVSFTGNEAVSSKKLHKTVKTKKRGPFSWLLSTGRFNDVTFQEDLDKLREYYKERGYLDININDSDVTLDYPTSKSIAININVDEGKQYRIGEIAIEGNTLFISERLLRGLRLKTDDVYSPEKLDEDREALSDFYGLVGYLDTRVMVDRSPNIATGRIDLNYRIREGDRIYLESILIEGNTKTKSVVILRELALAPGQVFNMVRMKNSKARLDNTRFFEAVDLTPEATNIPGRRNLKITVREGRTGQFQFGAGFSSLENGTFFAELSQSNFDLFNFRSFFQGDGQKFRLRFQIGSRSNSFLLAFEEPWLFEQRLALGFELFRSSTDFVSTLFNEKRSGFEVYMRKRLIGLWVARLSYRFEVVDIFDINQLAPDFILREAGERTVSKIGFNVTRDTRNDLIFTSKGSRISINSQFAGLGGDTDYIRVQTRAAKFIPTFELGEQTVSIIGSVGILVETGDDEVPFFDRFFMGGPNDLRGFEFRAVGPKQETDENGNAISDPEPTGGNTMGFLSVEYTVKIAGPLRVAAFYDWGFVNEGTSDFDFSDANSNWGFGVRLMVLNNPLRLDFGIPIQSDKFNNKGNQFNFSFGTRF